MGPREGKLVTIPRIEETDMALAMAMLPSSLHMLPCACISLIWQLDEVKKTLKFKAPVVESRFQERLEENIKGMKKRKKREREKEKIFQ